MRVYLSKGRCEQIIFALDNTYGRNDFETCKIKELITQSIALQKQGGKAAKHETQRCNRSVQSKE